MVHIDIDYQGNLRCVLKHGPSGTEIETDAPTDNQGRGERFSPTDLLATSLGACMATVMGIAANPRGILLDGMHVTVQKEMIADPLRRVGKLTVRITMPHDLPKKERVIMWNTANTCPVKLSLSPNVIIDLQMQFPDGDVFQD